MTHTATPQGPFDISNQGYLSSEVNGEIIADVTATPEHKAFILARLNAHDDLVKALTALYDRRTDETMAQARAAISKATETA